MNLLRDVSLFRYLNDHQLNIIGNLCSKESVKAGTLLFKENEVGSAFYLVISGSVKIYTSNAEGKEKILTVMHPGDSFGELSLIDKGTRSASARVVEDAVLYSLKAEHFNELLRMNFDITQGIMVELCNRLRETNRKVHDLTFLDERSRIMKALIQMASRNGNRDGHLIYFKVALNYEELAQIAGVKTELLLLVIQEFQRRSILVFSGGNYILDLSKIT